MIYFKTLFLSPLWKKKKSFKKV